MTWSRFVLIYMPHMSGGEMVGLHFALFFLKQVLREDALTTKELMVELEREDPTYHRSLQALMEHSVEDLGLGGVRLTRCVSSSITVLGASTHSLLIRPVHAFFIAFLHPNPFNLDDHLY